MRNRLVIVATALVFVFAQHAGAQQPPPATQPAAPEAGEAPALGICGSGLIDLIAGLLDARVIDPTGLIRVDETDRLGQDRRHAAQHIVAGLVAAFAVRCLEIVDVEQKQCHREVQLAGPFDDRREEVSEVARVV